MNDENPLDPDLPEISEQGRFFTAESDPSQEAAVLKARQGPGLVIEGPPGTGKSQTIVNMVSDGIGRGETVLIVCQKLPALQVVAKRLHAEGLADRFFMITDVNKERQAIVQALRQQLQHVFTEDNHALPAIQRQRDDLAARIETIQQDIDEHHRALHQVDAESGVSYRALIGELLALEASGPFVNIPALRILLGSFDRRQLSLLEETCSPLSSLWLAAQYENNALVVLHPFASDAALITDFTRDVRTFIANEEARDQVICHTPHVFDVDDPRPHQAWLDEHASLFRTMEPTTRVNLAQWFDLFHATGPETSRGQEAIDDLKALEAKLHALNASHHDAELFSVLAALPLPTLKQWQTLAQKVCTPSSGLSWLNPLRWRNRRKLRTLLAGLGESTSAERMTQLRDAVSLENDLRSLRAQFLVIEKQLYPDLTRSTALALRETRRAVSDLLAVLQPVAQVAHVVAQCPRRADAEAMIRSATSEAFDTLLARYDDAFKRYKAREASLTSLRPLSPWITDPWLDERRRTIATNRTNMAELDRMQEALPTTAAYQEFRTRAQSLSNEVMMVFAALRAHQEWFKTVNTEALPAAVRRMLAREARLSWKARMEKSRPVLLVQREEIEHKARTLASLDQEMHDLNRRILATDIKRSQLGTRQQWHALTLLRGPNAKRLREVIALGSGQGLMHLRPVWLMIPDVASRLLPLKAGLFDMVIFDEASQMPVEHALPALYRAKRMVISGDDKQMPPSSFFLSQIGSDEEDMNDDDEIRETATDAERTELVDAWNRREIKDCTDLLALGSAVLPRTMLEIHYRSQYRELVAFSNAAYYNGTLHIPVQHPDSTVRHIRPIEVLRVNGTYASQTNEVEAHRVVHELALMWQTWTHNRPSIGVVTFNRKQADLIEDLIEERAEQDPEFRSVLGEERGRQLNGEDLSFFVKNVENVQGDERDVIIFSSTFGRDPAGAFRRSFGVLGQAGGERRLNVAITRARRKIVIITSLPIGEISDMLATGRPPHGARDYLQAYFDYAGKVSDGDLVTARRTLQRLITNPAGRAPDPVAAEEGFITSVAAYIESLGLSPLRLGRQDAFGLDLAIEHPDTGLFAIGIECDAPQHPFLAKARYREIWRPTLLKRAVPHLHRVTSRIWYQQSTQERQRLQQAIEAALS